MTDTAANAAPLPVAADAVQAHAHAPARHWGHERLLSAAVLALFVWLFVSLWRLPALDHATIVEWLKNPLAAVPMLLLVAATFAHLKDGLIVIVDDYVHEEGGRLIWLALIKFAAAGGAALALFCVLRIALGGGAG